ncbi:MAG: alpha/beta fold hydrolase [Acidimicrobiales bacterium]|jgi:pimeloyl-ACP methyl ester carboxylesterase
MTVTFVHGNPETPVIWDDLVSRLERTDVSCLHLPGFGRSAPDGWGATKEEYVDWLIGELEVLAAADGPVDLVGHDWGGILTLRTVSLRPDLVRSWVSDALGGLHPAYVWHDFAQIWQTEGAGEKYFESFLATPFRDRVAVFESLGIPRATAERLIAAADPGMARCVLALYRSAVQPAMAEWGRELEPAGGLPGLSVTAPLDPFMGPGDLGSVVAERLGARTHVMEGQGHWWMLGDPAGGARALEQFWASI